ncbi:hypothetical protein CFBP3846_P500033 (plasmid) [Pseudomonas syringae pv. avii]|uniref:Secreted protein n=1 Tax=Pseudomonas syringae pv. avii TaxID=663959 RepID=A0ABY1UG91_PSESX|nr:hypothetical protein CFBP3846_P500033 [Pseudomonas syringae pv. avii]
MYCFRNNLLIACGFKCFTRPLNFVQNLLSLCVPNVSGRLSITCSGSRLKTRVLAISALFGSD